MKTIKYYLGRKDTKMGRYMGWNKACEKNFHECRTWLLSGHSIVINNVYHSYNTLHDQDGDVYFKLLKLLD